MTSVYSWNCITYTRDSLCAALTDMLMVQSLQCCRIDIILCHKAFPIQYVMSEVRNDSML